MKKIILIILCFHMTSSWAQRLQQEEKTFLLTDKKDDIIPESELYKYPEIHTTIDGLIEDRISSDGPITQTWHTRKDSSRLAISYALSQDYEDFTKVQTANLDWHFKFSDSYQLFWWGIQIQQTLAKYNAIAEKRVSLNADPNSVANIVRNDNIQSFTTVGLGLAHSFKALSEAFNTESIYEFFGVYLNYVLHLDNTDNQNYTGFGYTANYSIQRREGSSFFYGAKVSYNWVMTERKPVAEEPLSERSLVFGWTTFGLEFGYYY